MMSRAVPDRLKRGLEVVLVTVGVVAVMVSAIYGFNRALKPVEKAIEGAAPGLPLATADAGVAEELGADGGVLPDRHAFSGSARCQECHKGQHARWLLDWHSRALSPATQAFVAGDFHEARFKGTSSEAHMTWDGKTRRMRTLGPAGKVEAYEVSWVVGGKRMQDAITVLEDGRWQILPVYWHTGYGRAHGQSDAPAPARADGAGGEWVDHTEQKQGALSPDHPFFWASFRRTANRECLDCHASGVEVRYERATRRWTTKLADAGVACESCHGPGARHCETSARSDIVHPRKAGPEVGLAICARCHGPRNPIFPLLDPVHRFQPGDRYEDFYQPVVVVEGRQRSGDFFPDGRPRASSFEYQALLQSKCHRAAKLTCLGCHTPPHGLEKTEPELKVGPGSCALCHAELAKDPARHSHHQTAEGQDCLGCHMPRTVTGVLDTFADHAIDLPVPENTTRHGIPNACNACHTHRAASAEEMAKASERFWPGTWKQRRLRLADAIDEATAAKSRPALEGVVADAAEAPTLRAACAILLAQRFGPSTGTAIAPLLAQPDSLLRARAAEALAFAGARDQANAIAPLLADPWLPVKQAAALALATFDDPRAEPALRALASDPATETLAQPHLLLGMAAARRGELLAATVELEKAIDQKPYLVEALVMAADVYAKRGDWRMAKSRIEEAAHFDPSNPGVKKRVEEMGKVK